MQRHTNDTGTRLGELECQQIADAVRAEAYLAIRGIDRTPNRHEATLDECREAIRDAATLWTDYPPTDWIDEQAEQLHNALHR